MSKSDTLVVRDCDRGMLAGAPEWQWLWLELDVPDAPPSTLIATEGAEQSYAYHWHRLSTPAVQRLRELCNGYGFPLLSMVPTDRQMIFLGGTAGDIRTALGVTTS